MPRIVAIGASQGGVEALHRLASGLPGDFPAAILVVVHIGAGPSMLPSIINDLRTLPASHAVNGEQIREGHIYVAPPDHHMLVADGHIELSRGPRENWTRPAIDPLFRSVAEHYRQDAVGVILTGGLNDGTAGLYEIQRRGGLAVVQDPVDAEASSMPQSAVDNVDVDYCIPLKEMACLLVELVRQPKPREAGYAGEGAMAQENNFDRPVAQTCPECGGAMREENVGKLTQFRCHIGHMVTAEVLATAQLEIFDKDLSSVLRMLNERAALCRDLAQKHNARGDAEGSLEWTRAANEASARETTIRAMTEAEWIRPYVSARD